MEKEKLDSTSLGCLGLLISYQGNADIAIADIISIGVTKYLLHVTKAKFLHPMLNNNTFIVWNHEKEQMFVSFNKEHGFWCYSRRNRSEVDKGKR